MKFVAILLRQPKWAVILFALILTSVIGWADFLTGWDLNLSILYAVPVATVVLKTNRAWGLVFAILGTMAWWVANYTAHTYTTSYGYPLAAFTKLFYLIAVAAGAAAVKERRELDKELIAAFERTRELEREIVRASESEQRRIGCDLHDGLCQFLAGVGIGAHSLAVKLETKGVPESAAAREIESLIRDAAEQARSVAYGIFPVQMDSMGLSAALSELAALTSGTTQGVAVRFESSGPCAVRNPESGMHLYRIAQEALSNALRHGKARNVTIELSSDGVGLFLSVSDDGIGFAGPEAESEGMGTRTMTYRARILGGTLDIAPQMPRGTKVSCNIPDIARMNQGQTRIPHDDNHQGRSVRKDPGDPC